MVGKAIVQGQACQLELCTITPRSIEQAIQALCLSSILGEKEGTIARFVACNQLIGQHLEVLIETILRRGVKENGLRGRTLRKRITQ